MSTSLSGKSSKLQPLNESGGAALLHMVRTNCKLHHIISAAIFCLSSYKILLNAIKFVLEGNKSIKGGK